MFLIKVKHTSWNTEYNKTELFTPKCTWKQHFSFIATKCMSIIFLNSVQSMYILLKDLIEIISKTISILSFSVFQWKKWQGIVITPVLSLLLLSALSYIVVIINNNRTVQVSVSVRDDVSPCSNSFPRLFVTESMTDLHL